MFVIATPNDQSQFTLKLLAIYIRNGIYELFISEFWYRWPKVRPIFRPLQSMGEKWKRLCWTNTIRNTLKHWVAGRINTLSRNIATSDPSECRQSHFRSWKATSSFSAITFDRDQLDQWKHHRCVRADDMDRQICKMTSSDQVMTLTLGQVFKMTLSDQIKVHSTRLDKRNRMLAIWMSCLYWVKSYRVSQKMYHICFAQSSINFKYKIEKTPSCSEIVGDLFVPNIAFIAPFYYSGTLLFETSTFSFFSIGALDYVCAVWLLRLSEHMSSKTSYPQGI